MFLIYTIEDKLILKPDNLNISADFTYEDLVLKKVRDKYIGKVLLNHGIILTIKKLLLKTNLIVEIEGVINVEVYFFDLVRSRNDNISPTIGRYFVRQNYRF